MIYSQWIQPPVNIDSSMFPHGVSTSPEAQKLGGATKPWVETWPLVLADLSVVVLNEILRNRN